MRSAPRGCATSPGRPRHRTLGWQVNAKAHRADCRTVFVPLKNRVQGECRDVPASRRYSRLVGRRSGDGVERGCRRRRSTSRGDCRRVGGAVRSELVAVSVSAAAPAVDAAAVGGGTHGDRLPKAEEGPTPPVSCDHLRPPRPPCLPRPARFPWLRAKGGGSARDSTSRVVTRYRWSDAEGPGDVRSTPGLT